MNEEYLFNIPDPNVLPNYHEDYIVLPNYYIKLKGDDWIVYPWETRESETVQDYLKS